MTAGPETRAAGRLPLLDAALAPGRFDQPGRGIIAADSSHPVLSNFAAWRDLTVFQTVKLAKPGVAEVILELDDGTPLLIESSVGSGRLMILMSALDSQWNSLVISPAFIDFIVNTLSYLADDLLPVDVLVGQAFALPAQSIQLFDVSGKRVLGLGDTVGRPTVRIDEPGVYQLRTPGSTRLLAVNTDVRESDLSPAAQEVLQRWQSATATDITSDINSTPLETSDQGSVDERRIVPLAYWLLVALLLLVIAEPLLANGAGFGPGNSGADARKRA